MCLNSIWAGQKIFNIVFPQSPHYDPTQKARLKINLRHNCGRSIEFKVHSATSRSVISEELCTVNAEIISKVLAFGFSSSSCPP
jgi:hypothetical protein